MPTATSFNALGSGNGFSFCLDKVDVSDYDNISPWTLSQACAIYWNLNAIIGFFNIVDVDTLENVPINDVRIGDDIRYNSENGNETSDDSDYSEVVPTQRVCNSSRTGEKDTELGNGFNDSRISARLESNCIVKYYDGDTSDEDNFLGYGMKIDSIAQPLGFAYGFVVNSGSQFAHTIITTFYKATDYGSLAPYITVSEVTFSGIPLLKLKIETGSSGLGSDITDLEFYTYTT